MRKAGDVYISNQPFMLSSYQTGTTQDMVAKFGSPEQGQTNLDLFKAKTQKGWRGGMFQKNWRDDEMAGYITGFHHNALDEKLYLTPEMKKNLSAVGGMTVNGISAWVYFNGFLYLGFSLNSPSPDSNGMVKINLDTNAVTAITLPSAIRTASSPITSMIGHGTAIFLTGKNIIGGFFPYRYDGNTTFTNLNATNTLSKLVSFNDRLYGMGLATLYLLTNEFTGTISATTIKTVGISEAGVIGVNEMIEYNGAIYISKTDGLFRYNGVDVVAVVNRRKNVSFENFKNLTVFNGRMYWSERGKIVEFDGVNITQIVDMSDSYYIIAMEGGDDRLWISVRYNTTSSSIYESDNFPDPITTVQYTYGLFTYNGVGFFEYKNELYVGDEANTFGDFNQPVLYTPIPVDGYITWFAPQMFLNASMEVRSSGWYYWQQELAKEFELDQIGKNRESQIIGSITANEYPSVAKALNAVMTEADNIPPTGNLLLKVEARAYYEGETTDWILLWTSDNVANTGAGYDYFLHDEVKDTGTLDLETSPLLYHRIEYRITAIIEDDLLTVIPKLRSFTLRYTLQPRMRHTWILTINLFGNDPEDLMSPLLGDGSPETRKSNELRSIIYRAYKNKLPVLFYDLSFSTVIDDSPITIKGQDWLEDGDYLAFKPSNALVEEWSNRRIEVSGETADDTLITLDSIGYRESIGGSLSYPVLANNEVRKSYAVYIKSIQNERVHISDQNMNSEDGFSDYSSQITVELVEA